MKALDVIFTIMAVCSASLAQEATPAPPNGGESQPQQNSLAHQSGTSVPGQADGAIRIAPGSVIPVQLTKSIDAKKAKNGDEVEAKVTQDLKAGNGEVVVPKDTKVVGHVTEAQVRSKEQKRSQLAIAFDHAVMKNGSDLSLPMSIQAIIAPPNLNSAGGSDHPAPSAAPASAGAPSGTNGGRPGGMSAGVPATPSVPVPSDATGGDSQAVTNERQPITGKTQGVVGIPNLNLATQQSTGQGSVVSSEKNNVRLESGTLILLRVNPEN